MRFFLPGGLFLVLLFALKTRASGDVVNAIAVEGYRQVKSADELWRFHAGSTEAGLTLGSDCVCLLTARNLFLAGRGQGVYSQYQWCKRDEHWELLPMGGDKFALKHRIMDAYMSCANNGGVVLRGHAKGDEHFNIFINEEEDKISFYSVAQKKFVHADERGKTYCNTDKNDNPNTIFRGWKKGDKSAWMPSEKHEVAATFDNSASRKIKNFPFTATLGVKTDEKAEAGVVVDQPLLLTSALKEKFLDKDYKSKFQTDWSKQDKSIWEDAQKKDISWRMYPEDKVEIQQVVGIYGPFKIYTNEFVEIPVT